MTDNNELGGVGALQPSADRATAVEPVPVSPLRGGIPSAWDVPPLPCCFMLDALDFQVGAAARIVGAYAEEYPDPVRITGISWKSWGVDITVSDLDGDGPTDGFSIDEVVPIPRRAQAIETRRAETERLGAKHESAVGEADAP